MILISFEFHMGEAERERLKELRIYSQERRMERYRALYIRKILEGISPNCGIQSSNSYRRGREVLVPQIKGKGRYQSLREGSFQIQGARIFNSLLKSIRNKTKISIDEYKLALDTYLQKSLMNQSCLVIPQVPATK